MNQNAIRHILVMGIKWVVIWVIFIIMNATLPDKDWFKVAAVILAVAGLLVDLVLIWAFRFKQVFALVITVVLTLICVLTFKSGTIVDLYVAIILFYSFLSFISTVIVALIET